MTEYESHFIAAQPGFFAVYKQDDGTREHVPIVAWYLNEVRPDGEGADASALGWPLVVHGDGEVADPLDAKNCLGVVWDARWQPKGKLVPDLEDDDD